MTLRIKEARRTEAAVQTRADPRWARVLARDSSADGQFYYSVVTTGVYCRPSCGSRHARPENVVFHATEREARHAGFRPCKRCKPEELARGSGSVIRYVLGHSSLGAMLVAQSSGGICAILMGDDAQALVGELRERFPKHSLSGSDKRQLAKVLARVVGLIEGREHSLQMPLDLRGTEFQRRVWRALRKIPRGATAGYADIAARIRAPRAVRAVAQACAANALAVAIPCHRVVRRGGGLSGYRWGEARKRTLLEREAGA